MGLPIELVNVMQPGAGDNVTSSFYAAGVGVMFLLFSCAGAGGSLIEEEESGTLRRLISSRAGMTGVLLGKWLFITMMGVLQLCLMFTWGAVMFGLPLLPHLPGFLIVTLFTAPAPLIDLWPQVVVLTGLTAAFLAIARTLARRWETV